MLRIPVFGAALVTLAVTLAARLSWNAWPFELSANFPVQMGILALVLTVLAVALGARITLAITLIAVVINGVVVGRTLMTDGRAARSGGPRFTLGHLNAQTRPIDVEALGRYLMATHPDVFVVLDPTQSDIPMLTRTAPGYRVRRTGVHSSPSPEYVRTVVFSRVPIDDVRHPLDPAFGRSAVELVIPTAGDDEPISVVVFGTDSPTTPIRAQHRDQVLNAAARWSRARGDRRVVMGDFNATPWSPSFRHLLQDGRLFDSLDGFGLQVSWPESNLILRIPIDHALLGPSLAATDRGTGPAFGSQHRSLHVTVAPAR